MRHVFKNLQKSSNSILAQKQRPWHTKYNNPKMKLIANFLNWFACVLSTTYFYYFLLQMYLSPEQNRNVNFREWLFPLFVFLKEGLPVVFFINIISKTCTSSVRPRPLFWFRSNIETQIGQYFWPIP